MKKKSLIALLLACSFAFGAASMTGCNLLPGADGGNDQTIDGSTGDDKEENQGGTNKDKDEEQGKTVAVSGITLDLSSKTLEIGGTVQLTEQITPSNATNKTVTWHSDNTAVATVDANGLVTAVSAGTANITATSTDGSNKTSNQCAITVNAKVEEQDKTVSVSGITLDLSLKTLEIGGTVQLNAQVNPSNATNKTVTWHSSNTAVATVSASGLVTAVAAGTANITATSTDGSNKTSNQCVITVNAAVVPPKTYTVTFKSDGKEVDSKTVEENNTVTAPSDVTKTGYYLVGWFTGENTGSKYDFNQNITGNITLYARWESVDQALTYSYAGNECAAFEWGDTNPAGAVVKYKLTSENSYKTVDAALVRSSATSGVARVDIVGLKKNSSYDFQITTSSNKVITVPGMSISAYDRSGYAHFNYTSGVGAYNDDGTLKSSAKVYYVTESNKNNIDGNGTSLAELLENSSNGTASSLRNSAPIVIRVIGTVKCPQYLSANNLDSSIPDIDGITRTDQGNDSYWNMIDIKEGSNITVEGIGEDATIFQFGFTWKKCSSIEVRNLTFTDYPEDACSFEGDTNSPSSYKNIWLHHSVFNIGKNGWDKTDEQDKHDGDGATDLKGVSNVTFSYLQYNNCHKTGLVGGDDKHLTSNITFHHNFYNGNQQRLPLGRQANMHMYNNYYYKSTMYSISLRANAYAFIENNYFDNSNGKGTIEIRNSDKVANYGYGKLYNNAFANENQKGFQKYVGGKMTVFDGGDYIVEVSSRTQTVANTNSFNQNFDTDSSAFYYDATNKKTKVEVAMLTAEQVKTEVPQLAGVQKRNGTVGGGTTGGGSTEEPDPTPGGETVGTNLLEGKTGDVAKDSVIFDNDNLTAVLTTDGGGNGGKATYTQCTGKTSDNALSFSSYLLPGGGNRAYNFTAKANVTVIVYYTVRNSNGVQNNEVVATITKANSSTETQTSSDGTRVEGVAYKMQVTLSAGESFILTCANRLALYGIYVNV